MVWLYTTMTWPTTHLQYHICDYDQERISQADQEPILHRFDLCSAREWGEDGEIDGGEHDHARDVDSDDQVILGVPSDVVGGPVDYVHQECGQVSHQ